MKNLSKIRSDAISYFQTASADELYNLFSLLRDNVYDYRIISPAFMDCKICNEIYGPCGDSDLASDHCRNMFLRYCEEG